MKIHERQSPDKYLSHLIKRSRFRSAAFFLILYGLALFFLGSYAHSKNFYAMIARPAMSENWRIPFNYLQGLFSDPPHLSISLKHENFQKLAYKRDQALELGILLYEEGDEVNGTIAHDGLSYRTDMRLKGDWTDHLEGRKWSLRVNLDEGALFGMKQFSLNNPKTRNF